MLGPDACRCAVAGSAVAGAVVVEKNSSPAARNTAKHRTGLCLSANSADNSPESAWLIAGGLGILDFEEFACIVPRPTPGRLAFCPAAKTDQAYGVIV
jgi:hypothetical protein